MQQPDLLARLSAEELHLWQRVQDLWHLSAENDAARIRDALHPNYVGWDMSASITHNREQAVASASGGSAALVQYNLEPLSVRLYEGSTGVVHYRYTATVQQDQGQCLQVAGQWTEVYVKQGQQWLMVAVSGRPNPGERPASAGESAA
jgi:ketosteroid isomerase-like protein